MKKPRSDIPTPILSLMIGVLLMMPVNVGYVFAQESQAVRIEHNPLEYFVSGHRIRVEANVTDEAGIEEVRCYFRPDGQADYLFVSMDLKADNTYEGILPALSSETQTLEYLFVEKNLNDQVAKSQVFEVRKKDEEEIPAWQQVSAEGKITVSTELGQMPETLIGFSDNIVIDVVESSTRFGIFGGGVRGAYEMSGSGNSTGGIDSTTHTDTEEKSEELSRSDMLRMAGAVIALGAAIGVAASDSSNGNSNDNKPEVVSTDPPNGSTASSDLSEIIIRFNKEMKPSGSVSGRWGNASIDSGDWRNGQTFYITRKNIGEPLSRGAEISFTLSGFEDTAGNGLGDYSFKVTINDAGSVKFRW